MKRIYSEDHSPGDVVNKHLKGYMQTWYSCMNQLASNVGTRAPEDAVKRAQAFAYFYGIEIINHNKKEVKFHLPVWVGAYDVDAYLVEGCFVLSHALKESKDPERDKGLGMDKAVSKSAPKLAITMFSTSKGNMVAAAHKLELPLDSLVESIHDELDGK